MVRSVWGGKKRLQQIDKVINAASWLGKTHIHTLTHTLTSSREFFVVENVRSRANSFATLFWSSVCVCVCIAAVYQTTSSLSHSEVAFLSSWNIYCVAHYQLLTFCSMFTFCVIDSEANGRKQFIWWITICDQVLVDASVRYSGSMYVPKTALCSMFEQVQKSHIFIEWSMPWAQMMYWISLYRSIKWIENWLKSWCFNNLIQCLTESAAIETFELWAQWQKW